MLIKFFSCQFVLTDCAHYISTMLNTKQSENMEEILKKMREIAELQAQIKEKEKEIKILIKKEENK